MIDGKTCTCEPTSGAFDIRDPHCPLTDEQHGRQRAGETVAEPEYDAENRCTACGAHIAEPHQPGCPRESAPVNRFNVNDLVTWTTSPAWGEDERPTVYAGVVLGIMRGADGLHYRIRVGDRYKVVAEDRLRQVHKLIGATIRAANRTHGLIPAQPWGEPETVAAVINEHSLTVRTTAGNVYLLNDYVIVRYRPGIN